MKCVVITFHFELIDVLNQYIDKIDNVDHHAPPPRENINHQ